MPALPTLVFIHGMGGSAEDWFLVLEETKTLFRRDFPNYLLLEISNAPSLETVLDKLQKKIFAQVNKESPLIFCGYSMGGRLAVLLARHFLDKKQFKINGLFLISTGLGFSPEEEHLRKQRQQADEKWLLLWQENPAEFWKKWTQQPIFRGWQEIPQAKRVEWEKRRISLDSASLRTHLQVLSPSSHNHLLPTLKTLTENKISLLYMAGERDKKYCETAKSLESLKGTKTRIAPASSHALLLEQPRWVAEQLRDFLAQF